MMKLKSSNSCSSENDSTEVTSKKLKAIEFIKFQNKNENKSHDVSQARVVLFSNSRQIQVEL